ncbi:MAG: carboxypeptidase-like regulatory domain-containing protein [Bacteroidota bacterium]
MKLFVCCSARYLLIAILLMSLATTSIAQSNITEIRGVVLDSDTKKPLESAILSLKGTNISTVTNSEGIFSLKMDSSSESDIVLISQTGYRNKELPISDFKGTQLKIYLEENPSQLKEVVLVNYRDAENLVRDVFNKKELNNLNQSVFMTAFYRETIKRRRRNVSLTEAVVNLEKKSYLSSKTDEVELQIARKKTDYKKLDTLAFKLQGGPFTTLYLDIMKYPEYIFTEDTMNDYEFSFDNGSSINDRPVYVVNFKQKESVTALRYQGKLYIDAESIALASATYSLNLDVKSRARNFLVRKKPRDVVVYPTDTEYQVNYRQKSGNWYYAYSSVNLTFKVNKRRKLFNQVYSISSEMAITDWDSTSEDNGDLNERLRPSMILADRVSGFSDPNFWGEYNLIEPDKSIESAIEKIRKQIKKEKKDKS